MRVQESRARSRTTRSTLIWEIPDQNRSDICGRRHRAGGPMRYSTGGVRDYIPNGCGGPDLPATIDEVRSFQAWYGFAGHAAVTTWENGDVWGADFRDDGGDVDPS